MSIRECLSDFSDAFCFREPFRHAYIIYILSAAYIFLIWVVKEGEELLLGSPWGTYSKRIIDSSYRIKKPVFTYDELEDILKVSFKMYEDFKTELAQ